MKKATLIVLALLLALAIPLGIVSAAGPSTYGSSFQLQNLEGATANITLEFYASDGSVAATLTDTIAAYGSNNYFAVLVDGLPDPFAGSAVVSSDKELRAIHNLYGDDFQFGSAASAGYTLGSAEVNMPLIMRNNSGFNTWFSVQNAGSDPSTTVVTFTAGMAGNDYTPAAITIQPGASYRFDQAVMTQLGDVFIGSAQAASTNGQRLVATVVEVAPASLYAYDGFTSGSLSFIAPLFQYYNAGNSSSVNVKNTGDQDTTVTLTYTPSDKPGGGTYGTACQETQTVASGSSATFGLYAFVSVAPPGSVGYSCDCYDKNPGTQFVGSVEVTQNTANQNVVAVVNQHNLSTGLLASAYNAPTISDASQCVVLPLIQNNHVGGGFVYWTSINIVNVGSASTTVTIDYSVNAREGDDTDPAPETFTLGAGKSKSLLNYGSGNPVNGDPDLDYYGSATVCGANSTDQLLIVVNQQSLVGGGDSQCTYNGFSVD